MSSSIVSATLLLGAMASAGAADGEPRLRKLVNPNKPPSLEFDQEVAGGMDQMLFGSSNYNGGFTVHRNNGIEIGLRTKLSYPVIENEYNSNGDGTYSWTRISCFGEPSDCKIPHWSMEFSVTTFEGHTVGDYCWELGMDADPSPDTDFTIFDPISKSETAAFYDHSFGQAAGGVQEGNSIYKLGADCTSSLEMAQVCAQYYQELLSNYDVVQNYWNFGFASLPGTSLYYFDRAVSGNYVVYLRAIDCKRDGKVLAESHVQILVGIAQKVDKPNLPDASLGGYQPHSRTLGCSLHSNIEYSQDVSTLPDSVPNGGFVTDRRNGIEVGLRTRQRFTVHYELPANDVFHDNGDGVYWWGRSDHCESPDTPCSHAPQWVLELSVNTNYDGTSDKSIGDYCWELGIDGDASKTVNFHRMDPMSTSSGKSAHVSIDFETFKNLAGNPLEQFSGVNNGSYIVYLRAMECTGRRPVLAETNIQILVGEMYPAWEFDLPEPKVMVASAVI